MGITGSGLQKLQLVGYQDKGFSTQVGSFSMPINPKSFQHSYSIDHSIEKVQGKSAALAIFGGVGIETVDLKEIYIDTTGAIPLTGDNQSKTVTQLIASLKQAVYTYIPATHAPPFVQLTWGTFIFNSVLEKLDVEYQLFQPDGSPLRAKVNMTFKSLVTPSQESSQANRQSPDVTHILTVKHGDSLPALCNQVYNDSSYYLQIAAFNELTSFRNLQVGSQIIFPPLKQ